MVSMLSTFVEGMNTLQRFTAGGEKGEIKKKNLGIRFCRYFRRRSH
jgi:hypothetical protein